MIRSFQIKNFGPVSLLNCDKLGCINVLIGRNGTGKTQLMKALYATVWATEQLGRGMEKRSMAQLIANKLDTTFIPKKLGDLVTKGADGPLELLMTGEGREKVRFAFGKDTNSTITNVENSFAERKTNSIFIPAKEVISLQEVIRESRSSKYNAPAFDDTYLDLANALTPTTKGKNYQECSQARKVLAEAIRGKLEYDAEKREWIFKDEKNRTFSLSLTSEGVKKMSVLDVLLGNRFLSRESIVFIDEMESALHPKLISEFVEMIVLLSKIGIQFFLATHSYAVIKKLYIVAHREKISVPCISLGEEKTIVGDLMKEMPDNEIVNESIRLYEEELDL